MAANAAFAPAGLFICFIRAGAAGRLLFAALRALALFLLFLIGDLVRFRALLNLRLSLVRLLGLLLQICFARRLTGRLLSGILAADVGLLRDDLL